MKKVLCLRGVEISCVITFEILRKLMKIRDKLDVQNRNKNYL